MDKRTTTPTPRCTRFSNQFFGGELNWFENAIRECYTTCLCRRFECIVLDHSCGRPHYVTPITLGGLYVNNRLLGLPNCSCLEISDASSASNRSLLGDQVHQRSNVLWNLGSRPLNSCMFGHRFTSTKMKRTPRNRQSLRSKLRNPDLPENSVYHVLHQQKASNRGGLGVARKDN